MSEDCTPSESPLQGINEKNTSESEAPIDDSSTTILEEEQYFVVEFSGLVDRLAIKDKLHSAKFIGIETDEPMLQIENTFFRGHFVESVGTSVLFDSKGTDFVAKTDKKLVMKRVFLK